MVTPQPAKIYTFQGNVLLLPNIYLDKSNASDSVNNVNICGVLSLDTKDNQQQKYCYKLSELHNRLYDADHIALDVWDVRGNYYLMLTKSTDTTTTTDAANKQQELWVDKGQFGVYHPYADITQQKLLFLGDWDYQIAPTWPLQAYDGPDGKVIELKKENYPTIKSTSPMVTIISVAQSSKNELWFRLNLINSLCEQQTNPPQPIAPVIMNVWYPAYRVIGNLRVPTVWYSAKGC
jgi:hypothetical protein